MTDVVVLSAPGCHLCEDAARALEELAERFDLDVRIVDLRTADGERLVAEHRPPMPPAVLLNGRLFSSGRLPRRKLLRALERAAPVDGGRAGEG